MAREGGGRFGSAAVVLVSEETVVD